MRVFIAIMFVATGHQRNCQFRQVFAGKIPKPRPLDGTWKQPPLQRRASKELKKAGTRRSFRSRTSSTALLSGLPVPLTDCHSLTLNTAHTFLSGKTLLRSMTPSP
jgi:hypothetical protein